MSTKLTRTTMLVAVLGLATSVFATNDSYRTKTGASNWGTTSSWEILKLGSWVNPFPGDFPNAGDTVSILHNLSVGANAGCAVLTVDAGTLTVSSSFTLTVSGNSTITSTMVIQNSSGTFDSGGIATVANGGQVTIDQGGVFQTNSGATSPGVVVVGTITCNGQLKLNSSSGVPYLQLQTSRTMPAAGGQIMGVATAASRPEIRLDSGVTMTNAGTVEGYLKIMGSSADVGTFANNGTVSANLAQELLIDSTLSSIADNTSGSSAVWNVNYDDPAAVLRFGQGGSGLTGQFQLLQGRGILQISASISTPTLRVDQGRIVVDTSQTFTYGTVSGSCSGSVPASPMNAGSYPSVSTFYCYP